ncbi:MAG: SUMF1/EgtB/PvdO family nonheme iron enzyme [Flavobacteriales bacterium]|nr:SUMF1/EgtB/PvdO family nonheme iron enzyme [Flavobacteriales bacterium]
MRNNNRAEELRVAELDTLNWLMADVSNPRFYVENYHKQPDHPVVNVSQEGAMAFCKWLGEIWNSQQDKYLVEFRLPTHDEWFNAYQGGNFRYTYPWGGPEITNKKGCYLAHVQGSGDGEGPVKTATYTPNGFGIFNISGNVSEWIADTNSSCGGHWESKPEDATVESVYGSAGPSVHIGFRPVMTFKPRNLDK